MFFLWLEVFHLILTPSPRLSFFDFFFLWWVSTKERKSNLVNQIQETDGIVCKYLCSSSYKNDLRYDKHVDTKKPASQFKSDWNMGTNLTHTFDCEQQTEHLSGILSLGHALYCIYSHVLVQVPDQTKRWIHRGSYRSRSTRATNAW